MNSRTLYQTGSFPDSCFPGCESRCEKISPHDEAATSDGSHEPGSCFVSHIRARVDGVMNDSKGIPNLCLGPRQICVEAQYAGNQCRNRRDKYLGIGGLSSLDSVNVQ